VRSVDARAGRVLASAALPTPAQRGRRLCLTAAAKVNLVLEILGKRVDGYHELATVMQTVDLADRLVLEDAEEVTLTTSSPNLPADGSNLALRAAVALRDAANVDRGVRIELAKRIPVAAGLGGGSTDAAAVLLGLSRLWGLRWPRGRLAEVAVTLGMDVPFFLEGGVAMATGRGEKLSAVGGAPLSLVLINPGTPLSTATVYGRVTPAMYSSGEHARAMVEALRTRRAVRVAANLYNGLEAAAAGAAADLTRIRAALLAAGALGAAMSGSGPTVFGVARSFEHARQIRTRLVRGSWACWAVRTVSGPAVRIRAA
jgi:4-diphosphocytidyl-2-C-methyl-D-erythritol kinase